MSPTAEAERVRIAEIERMLGRGELVTGADRITVSMRQFGRSKALEDLEERARNLAKSKAADAKQRAERAGRSNLADFKRGEQQMADGASAERGRESLSRIVAVYGDAETLFERAADASVPPAPPTLPTTPALTPTATPITTPVPPAPSAPTPSPTAVVRRPVMDNDDAQGLLQALANLWEKFDPKQLAQIYPNIMNLDTDKSRLATLKQVNSRCSLTFGKVDVRPNDKSEDVLLVADSERVCQPKTGSRFDPLHETNFVTVHKVGNQWQVVGWATQVIKR